MSNVPEEFICPITMEIMVHPMATRYGHTFERSAIVAWINDDNNNKKRESGECPLTRKPLRMTDVFPNHYLVVQIRAWREQNGLEEHSPSARQNNGREFMQEFFEKIQNDFEAMEVSSAKVEAAASSVSPDNAPTLRLSIAALRRKQPNVAQAAAASAARQRDGHRRSTGSVFTRRSR